MEGVSVEGKTEMIFIYAEYLRNIGNVDALYAECFSNSQRSSTSFHRVIKEFPAEGSLKNKPLAQK